jgi:hypothetical protein
MWRERGQKRFLLNAQVQATVGLVAASFRMSRIVVVEEVVYTNNMVQGMHMVLGLVGDREAPIRIRGMSKGKDPKFQVSAHLAGSSPEAAIRMLHLRLIRHCKPALQNSGPASNTRNIRNKNIGARQRHHREQTRGYRGYGGDPV